MCKEAVISEGPVKAERVAVLLIHNLIQTTDDQNLTSVLNGLLEKISPEETGLKEAYALFCPLAVDYNAFFPAISGDHVTFRDALMTEINFLNGLNEKNRNSYIDEVKKGEKLAEKGFPAIKTDF